MDGQDAKRTHQNTTYQLIERQDFKKRLSMTKKKIKKEAQCSSHQNRNYSVRKDAKKTHQFSVNVSWTLVQVVKGSSRDHQSCVGTLAGGGEVSLGAKLNCSQIGMESFSVQYIRKRAAISGEYRRAPTDLPTRYTFAL